MVLASASGRVFEAGSTFLIFSVNDAEDAEDEI